jgi:3,4-dihydroxy-2-butanone 4-phosphate synthase
VQDDEMVRVREALSCLYGAVAALLRQDRSGCELLLGDLRDAFDDVGDVLVAISVATLERLEAAVSAGPSIAPHEGRPIAQDLLALAAAFGSASHHTVQYAAWRLDGVRQGDRRQAVDDIRRARTEADDDELVRGAVALLAATVVLWARRTGQTASRAASDLCLAASLDPAA